MTKPVLLLDMDGPLADFDGALWNWVQRMQIPMDITSLIDVKRQYFMTENMVDHNDRVKTRYMLDKSSFFRTLPITMGAREGVQDLMVHFDVWVCTKPLDTNPTCRDDKMWWISQYFPELYSKVIMTPKKSLVHGDILLDDAPDLICVSDARWTPVVFTDTFNGAHSKWGHLPFWSWSDPIDILLKIYYEKESNA